MIKWRMVNVEPPYGRASQFLNFVRGLAGGSKTESRQHGKENLPQQLLRGANQLLNKRSWE
jgi:hypothetical protein